MTNEDRGRPSLKEFNAYADRNGQDNGQDSPLDLARPSQTQAHLKRDPMGEAETARLASGLPGQDATDATEAETPPDTIRRLSDATLSPNDKDATAEAIERAASAGQKPGEPR